MQAIIPMIESKLNKLCNDFSNNNKIHGCAVIQKFRELIQQNNSLDTSTIITDKEIERNENAFICHNYDQTFLLACRYCRFCLFDNTLLQSHTDEFIETVNEANNANSICTSWFLQEPADWMKCSDISGKISCGNCNMKLGYWNWSGSKCSCMEDYIYFYYMKNKLYDNMYLL
jgi:hypothetical protein